jgi:uncharacterized protein YbcI
MTMAEICGEPLARIHGRAQARAEELGAVFLFNTKVEKIIVKKRQGLRLETADGRNQYGHFT